jgi:hypothetical protein
MEGLIQKVITCAEERNLVNESDIKTETLKLISKFGEVANSILNSHDNHIEDCRNFIGRSLVGMIVICRMRNISFYECLKLTQEINDHQITNPTHVMTVIFKEVGDLSKNIASKKDIKTEMGYLLIYVTVLTKIFHYSIHECLEIGYNHLKTQKGIVFDGVFIEETDEKYAQAVAILNSSKSEV